MKLQRILCIGLFFSLFAATANAEEVRLALDKNIAANANYIQAEDGKPTIILLHPFLQTYHFNVISSITDLLAEEGYGVLAPTLSLGISDRKQSMACEAIHTQTMEDYLPEIDAWIKWLQDRKVTRLIAAGHSTGATTMMMYAEKHPHVFKKLILISPLHYDLEGGVGIDENQLLEALAEEQKNTPQELKPYRLSYCAELTTTRDVYLKFTHWNETNLSAMFPRVAYFSHMVYGLGDDSINPSWRKKIESSNMKLYPIESANHFYAGQSELDLHDTLLEILEE